MNSMNLASIISTAVLWKLSGKRKMPTTAVGSPPSSLTTARIERSINSRTTMERQTRHSSGSPSMRKCTKATSECQMWIPLPPSMSAVHSVAASRPSMTPPSRKCSRKAHWRSYNGCWHKLKGRSIRSAVSTKSPRIHPVKVVRIPLLTPHHVLD